MGTETLASSKYLSFTTFTKDGTAKPTPVWIVDLGTGELGFTTASSSWKVKRLRNNPSVILQPSDSRGRVTDGSEPVEGTARVEIGGAEFERVKGLVRQKYGFQHILIGGFGKLMSLLGKGKVSDAAVIVTLS